VSIKFALYCLILFLGFTPGYCQWKIVDSSADAKPSWVTEAPKGKVFRYYAGMGSSNTSLQQAQQNAVGNILQQLVEEGSFNVSIESKTEISEKILTTSGGDKSEIIDDYIQEIVRTGTSKTIQGLQKEEEFWQSVKRNEGIEHQYWVLFKIPRPGVNPDIALKQGYGLSPIWKSALIPGWGQRYKGESRKGSKFLISTATAGAATFIAFYMSDSYYQKAINERDIDNRKFYNTWSDRSYTIGIISGLITGGLYGYNIFDAITAPGAKKYAQSSTEENHRLFATYDGYSAQVRLKLLFN
jgi:hypothetical protein